MSDCTKANRRSHTQNDPVHDKFYDVIKFLYDLEILVEKVQKGYRSVRSMNDMRESDECCQKTRPDRISHNKSSSGCDKATDNL